MPDFVDVTVRCRLGIVDVLPSQRLRAGLMKFVAERLELVQRWDIACVTAISGRK
jgi:hypothetical protein